MAEYNAGQEKHLCLAAQGMAEGCKECIISKNEWCKDYRALIEKRWNRLQNRYGNAAEIFQEAHEQILLELMIADDFKKGTKKLIRHWLVRIDSGSKGPQRRGEPCPGNPKECPNFHNESCLVQKDGFCEWVCDNQGLMGELLGELERAGSLHDKTGYNLDRKKVELQEAFADLQLMAKIRSQACRCYNKFRRIQINKFSHWANNIISNTAKSLDKKNPKVNPTPSTQVKSPPFKMAEFCMQYQGVLRWSSEENRLYALAYIDTSLERKLKTLSDDPEWNRIIAWLARESRKITESPLPDENEPSPADGPKPSGESIGEKPKKKKKYGPKKINQILQTLLEHQDEEIVWCARMFLLIYEFFRDNKKASNGAEKLTTAKHLGITIESYDRKNEECGKKLAPFFMDLRGAV